MKEVPDPERFGVVAYEDDRIVDLVEKAGVVDKRYTKPPSSDAVVGLYCFGPDVFEIIRGLAPSERGELEITDVNRAYALRGDLVCARVQGWWRDAGTHESTRADRHADRGDRGEQGSMTRPAVAGVIILPLRKFEDERGWFFELRRDSLLPGRPFRRTCRSPARASFAGCTITSAARTTSSRVCPGWHASSSSTGPAVRRCPSTSETRTRSRSTFRAFTGTVSKRSPIACSAIT